MDSYEKAIKEYPGTVIFSAHDRFLIDRIANKVVYIGDGKAMVHSGNWTDYEEWRNRRRENLKVELKDNKKTSCPASIRLIASFSTLGSGGNSLSKIIPMRI